MSTDNAETEVKMSPEGETKPNIVEWDSPTDAANPLMWTKQKKMVHVLVISGITLYSNLAAVMFAPGASRLADEFEITESIIISLTVSICILGFVVGPMFVASLSEVYGRLIVYHVGNVVYLGFTIGCALSKNTAQFLIFRFICGCAASIPNTIGGGTVADLYQASERGKALALFALGPLLGPVVGPVIGGFVTQYLGWRWTFWLILILAGIFSFAAIALMRETFEPVLLNRKAALLRKTSGNEQLRARTYHPDFTPSQMFLRAIVRPTRMLLFSPIISLLSLHTAFLFGLTYLLFTTFPAVFEEQYGFKPDISGLAYLGLGIGMILSIALFSLLSDKLLHQPHGGTLTRPELRLILMVWTSPCVPIGFFWYGWSSKAQTHWIVPILGTAFIGIGAFLILLPAQLYLVDAFGAEAAASALAANTILRSLLGHSFLLLVLLYMLSWASAGVIVCLLSLVWPLYLFLFFSINMERD